MGDVRHLLERGVVRGRRADAVDAARAPSSGPRAGSPRGRPRCAAAACVPPPRFRPVAGHRPASTPTPSIPPRCSSQPFPSARAGACQVTAFTSAPSAWQRRIVPAEGDRASAASSRGASTSTAAGTSRSVARRKRSSRRSATAVPASPGPPATRSALLPLGRAPRRRPTASVAKREGEPRRAPPRRSRRAPARRRRRCGRGPRTAAGGRGARPDPSAAGRRRWGAARFPGALAERAGAPRRLRRGLPGERGDLSRRDAQEPPEQARPPPR